MAARITQEATQSLIESDAKPQITQAGIESLVEVTAKPQIEQLPVQVLAGVDVVPRITNNNTQVLIELTSVPRLTQFAVQVLAHEINCMSFLAQSWRIARRDGIIHAFTAHDQPILFKGDLYEPCGSIQPTAYQAAGQFGEVGNANLLGLISIDGLEAGIPARDIAAGLLDAAEIQIWDLPWKGDEKPFPILKGYVGTITQKDINYDAEVLTLSGLLANRALLESFTPNCRFMLGDARCTVNLAGFTDTGFVTEEAAGSVAFQAGKRQFIDISRIEADDYWANGMLTWTSGNNTGYSSEVAGSTDQGGITLWNVMPSKIIVGDAYTIVAGCDKKRDTCINKFNNIANFGGFPDVPGNDIILQTPDAKQ